MKPETAGKIKFSVWGLICGRKKHKNQILGLVSSMCYNEQKSNFKLFTNTSSIGGRCHECGNGDFETEDRGVESA